MELFQGHLKWEQAAVNQTLRPQLMDTLDTYKARLASAPASSHYKAFPGGVEPIMITRHLDFCRGNAVKYLTRAHLKHKTLTGELEDLEKAAQYLAWAIEDQKAKIKAEKLPEPKPMGTLAADGSIVPCKRCGWPWGSVVPGDLPFHPKAKCTFGVD